MIALIALAALTIVLGVLVGVTALLVAIIKSFIRLMRGPRSATAAGSPAGRGAAVRDDEQEFQRIVAWEWPNQ